MDQPYNSHQPTLSEDLTNLSTIALATLVALTVTGRFLSAPAPSASSDVEVVSFEAAPISEEVDPDAGVDRLYGTVVTKSGSELTGYIRWNGREAS